MWQFIGILLVSALVGWFLPWKILLLLTTVILSGYFLWTNTINHADNQEGPMLIAAIAFWFIIPPFVVAWCLKGIRMIDANTWSEWFRWWTQ
ncbi:MAG: hypothetical protein HZA35_01355 [Parcubacteria group bacterium]|nr:hypothetical protein [Parcubacteria group bacterium]